MNWEKESSPPDFIRVSKEIFRPIYKELASFFLQELSEGDICLDIGTGIGLLPFYMRKFSRKKIRVFALDNNSDRLLELTKLIRSEDVKGVIPVSADAHALPFGKNTIDMVTSRGSLHLWERPTEVFDEINRVLKEAGKVAIGGTLGLTEKTRRKVRKSMTQKVKDSIPSLDRRKIESSLRKSNLEDWEVSRDEQGFWITKNISLTPEAKVRQYRLSRAKNSVTL